MDYRDLEHSNLQFDKIVSVGMLEHVGRTNYDLFLKNVNAVLKPGGISFFTTLVGLKKVREMHGLEKYIFPGGTIPSLRGIVSLSADYNFHVIDIENLRPHYRMTLLHWYKNFEAILMKLAKNSMNALFECGECTYVLVLLHLIMVSLIFTKLYLLKE